MKARLRAVRLMWLVAYAAAYWALVFLVIPDWRGGWAVPSRVILMLGLYFLTLLIVWTFLLSVQLRPGILLSVLVFLAMLYVVVFLVAREVEMSAKCREFLAAITVTATFAGVPLGLRRSASRAEGPDDGANVAPDHR